MSCLRSATRVAAIACLVGLGACGAPTSAPSVASSADGWREFDGTWTATGNRQTISLGPSRSASVATFDGSVVLAGPDRPGVGFRAQAVVLNDTASGMIGRAVWTDEHGDQAFSELRGEGSTRGNRIEGRFIGGTGRYAGAEGTYAFAWRFLLENEDGNVQGQSVGLRGRVRLSAAAGEPRPGKAP